MRGMTDGMADGRCEAIFEQRAGLAGRCAGMTISPRRPETCRALRL